MIRITGGTHRSRLLKTPESENTKPTMDKVRLGVFSALSNKVYNAKVLDLFAGSGSYGFESISRGAKNATFVDSSTEAIKCIEENAKTLKCSDNEIILSDVIKYLETCTGKFDIIFMDAPYKLDLYNEIISIIISQNLLSEKGIIVLESEKELTLNPNDFVQIKSYKYGIARIYILRK